MARPQAKDHSVLIQGVTLQVFRFVGRWWVLVAALFAVLIESRHRSQFDITGFFECDVANA